MLIHGVTPYSMSLSTIIPIPKNSRKSLNDSSNYRGIALLSPIGKLLDLIIISQHGFCLKSSDLQFGYKKSTSTTHCTMVAKEVVNYYINNGSNVYTTLLDASKAFDRINFIKLFKLLMLRNLCPVVCRLLALQYTLQKCCVKYEDNV